MTGLPPRILEVYKDRAATPWRQFAACHGTDPDIFFPNQGGDLSLALALCAKCTQREPCVSYAVRTGQAGIWGGTSEKERRRLRREMRAAS